MNNYQTNTSIISLLWKWRIAVIAITVIGLITSIIVSLLIPDKFKSTAVIYPANISPFSAETKTEQMMQMMQSSYIRDKVIDKYDLFRHYDIDTTKPYYKTYIIKEFNANVIFTKSEFESVIIDVVDKDRDTAFLIAMSIIDFYNEKTRNLQREKAEEMMRVYKKGMEEKLTEMDSMELEMSRLRIKYDLLDYGTQVKEATRSSLRDGRSSNTDSLLFHLKSKGGELVSINEHLWRIRGQYNDLKEAYETELRNVRKELTYTNIVTNPVPADKKTYPIRSLIVLVSTAASFFFAIMLIVAFENYQRILKTIKQESGFNQEA